MQHIRIPTPDAPASHRLTFICAVAGLAHRIIQRKTGLDVRLTVAVHDIGRNRARIPALRAAAEAAQLVHHKVNQDVWHTWQNHGNWNCADVVVYSTDPAPVAPEEPVRVCEYFECEADALPGMDFCADHQTQYEAMAAALVVEPETTAELSQVITTEFENAALAEQWDAASILRREG